MRSTWFLIGSEMAGLPPWPRNSAFTSGGRREVTKARKASSDPLGVLLADEPERDLGAGLGRQHGLGALAGVAADNPVHFAGRPRPQDFERRAVALARRRRQPDLAQERPAVEIELVPLVRELLRNFFDAVIEAGDGDRAGIVVQLAEDLRQHMDRVDGQAAVKARMQIAIGAGEDDFFGRRSRAARW